MKTMNQHVSKKKQTKIFFLTKIATYTFVGKKAGELSFKKKLNKLTNVFKTFISKESSEIQWQNQQFNL